MSASVMMAPIVSSSNVLCLPVGRKPQRDLKHKRRYCRHAGCSSIVKSQGLCQRHGAKPRLCKIEGCPKQAQGNFNGMCKAHYKTHGATAQQEPQATSIYDSILPASIAWTDPDSVMPLIQLWRDGHSKPAGWFRVQENQARNNNRKTKLAVQLQDWECDLINTTVLLMTGCAASSDFDLLAHAWGQARGFYVSVMQRHWMSSSTSTAAASYEPDEITSSRPNKRQKKNRHSLDGGAITLLDDDVNEALAADLLFFSATSIDAGETVVSQEDDGKMRHASHKRFMSFDMRDFEDDDENAEVTDQEIEEILLSSEDEEE